MKKLSNRKYIAIFAAIVLGFFFLTFVEVSVEGPYGGATHSYGWAIQIYDSVKLAEYHLFLFYLAIPIFLLITVIAVGFDLRLIAVIFLGYSVGSIVEDISWFVFNPYYGIQKLSPQYYTWFFWLNIGNFQIPIVYFIHSIIIVADILFIFKGIPLIEKHRTRNASE